MMNKIKYNSYSEIKEAEKLIQDGYDIILDFSKKADPKKLQKILTYFGDKYGIKVNIRDAKLKEILAGLGASAGLLSEIASATLNVKIYKYCGNTLVKITQ
jgi:hypothetical protein